MGKRKQFNFPLYRLATANLVYAVLKEFTWLTWVALLLTAIVFAWDIWEGLHNG